MGTESRRYKRWDIFEYAMIEKEGADADPAIVVDLSLGGLQSRSKIQYEAGEICSVLIARSANDPIVIRAEVRYCRPVNEETGVFVTGLRFLPESVEQRISLVHYIHDRFLNDLERLAV